MSSRDAREKPPARTSGFFDAHCDTVMKVLDEGVDFLIPHAASHVSWEGMKRAGLRAQVFACFVLSARHPGCEFERAGSMIDAIYEMAEATQGDLRIVLSARHLREAFSGGPAAGILSLEGADPLQGRADAIEGFFSRGIRSVIFAWQDNAFSGTAFGSNTPLTAQGRRLLGRCEELKIVVDVSHLSDKAFDEVDALASKPFIASHSNCRALCPSPRNLTDAMIRTLADRGGVMGINLSPSFLDPSYYAVVNPLIEASNRPGTPESERQSLRAQARSVPRPPLRWIAGHILHAMDVGGEDCVGFGADLDGIGQTPAGVDSVADFAAFVPLLQEAGLSDRQLEKVCYQNFVRVFSELLPES